MAIGIAFLDYLGIAVIIFVVGYLCLTTIILAKYAAYPQEISIPQAILMGLGFSFPPFLLVVLPMFYQKAITSLQPILEGTSTINKETR